MTPTRRQRSKVKAHACSSPDLIWGASRRSWDKPDWLWLWRRWWIFLFCLSGKKWIYILPANLAVLESHLLWWSLSKLSRNCIRDTVINCKQNFKNSWNLIVISRPRFTNARKGANCSLIRHIFGDRNYLFLWRFFLSFFIMSSLI